MQLGTSQAQRACLDRSSTPIPVVLNKVPHIVKMNLE